MITINRKTFEVKEGNKVIGKGKDLPEAVDIAVKNTKEDLRIVFV